MGKCTMVVYLALAVLIIAGNGAPDVSAKSGPEIRKTAEAQETIEGKDTAGAIDRAGDKAVESIVAKVAGEKLNYRPDLLDADMFHIMQEKERFLKDVSIQQQGSDGKSVTVRVSCSVLTDNLGQVIDEIYNKYGRPGMVLLVRELFEGRVNEPGFTNTEIILSVLFRDGGYQLLSPEKNRELYLKVRKNYSAIAEGNINPQDRDVLLGFGGDVLITGMVETMDQSAATKSYGRDMKTKQCKMKLKAIDVRSGNILAMQTSSAPGVHLDDETAARQAIARCVERSILKKDAETGAFLEGVFLDNIRLKYFKANTSRAMKMKSRE